MISKKYHKSAVLLTVSFVYAIISPQVYKSRYTVMKDFIKRIGIPEEAHEIILDLYERIKNDTALYGVFTACAEEYLDKGEDFNTKQVMEEFSEKLCCNIYTVHLVFLLECAVRVRKNFQAKGISEEVYYDTMSDIGYKVPECKKRFGVYGISTFTWYHWIFKNTYKLGRLEYAVINLAVDSYKHYAKKGDIIYGCHIPSGEPLTYDSVMESLKKAYRFFKCEKYMVVQCESWMMSPPLYREVFPEGSNLRMFYELFDVTDEIPVKDNASNFWRVFYKEADTPLSELPAETRLQRNLIKYLSEGKLMHKGRGFIVFDGEKIINR